MSCVFFASRCYGKIYEAVVVEVVSARGADGSGFPFLFSYCCSPKKEILYHHTEHLQGSLLASVHGVAY